MAVLVIAVVLFGLMSKKCVFTCLFTSAYKIHLYDKKVGALHAESLKNILLSCIVRILRSQLSIKTSAEIFMDFISRQTILLNVTLSALAFL